MRTLMAIAGGYCAGTGSPITATILIMLVLFL